MYSKKRATPGRRQKVFMNQAFLLFTPGLAFGARW